MVVGRPCSVFEEGIDGDDDDDFSPCAAEGQKADSSGLRSAGRQAHMIPRLDSMTVHMDEGMEFQVVSVWEVAMSRVVMRRMEVMQTLTVSDRRPEKKKS